MKRHEQLSQFSNILAIALFGMSALGFFKSGQILFGFILLIISILSVFFLVFMKDKKKHFTIILNSLNALAAGIVTYDYILQGTKYIHYLWFFTTILFIALTIFLIFRKEKISLKK